MPAPPPTAPAPPAAPRASGRRVLVALALAIALVAGAVALWGRLAPRVIDARERMRDKALPAALRFL